MSAELRVRAVRRRLAGCSTRNRFYKANRDLGRILKTEFTLDGYVTPDVAHELAAISIEH